MFFTWNESAEDAVKLVFSQVRKTPVVTVQDLRSELDKFIKDLYRAPAGNERAMAHWSVVGATSIELADQTVQPLTVAEVVSTLVKKQSDYGPENIRRFGRQGLMVRCHDKVARLENLIATNRQPKNESVHDTYLDLVGYSAIGIMWERNEFLLPLDTRSIPV